MHVVLTSCSRPPPMVVAMPPPTSTSTSTSIGSSPLAAGSAIPANTFGGKGSAVVDDRDDELLILYGRGQRDASGERVVA